MNSDTFIDIACLISGSLIDIRYASKNNGFKARLYGNRRCLLRYGTALNLLEAQAVD
ncbi:MAG: hypothetical protein IT210_24505 [Armatimonadetes bacterium]|nr:hypothetical protein [Armatimonadota bacterium]